MPLRMVVVSVLLCQVRKPTSRLLINSSTQMIFLFVFVNLLLTSSAKQTSIELKNNTYSEVLVAINKDVAEDPDIIANLKKILTAGSKQLYWSTNNRAYFKSFTILIPPTWKHKVEYVRREKERYNDADIVVAPENKQFGDTPYVKSFGGCGDPGQFLHLTPSFVTDDAVRKMYGDVGKVVVHEWGHLRWGLQVEYPSTAIEPRWYFSTETKKFEAVRCSLSTKGQILQVTGNNKYRICKLDQGLPDSEECQFFPGFNMTVQPSKVSIMDRQGTKNVTHFCKLGTDKYHLHNQEAPNRMNRLCGGKSTWDIMNVHPDFKGKNPVGDLGQEELEPNFKLVQAVKGESKCIISLVLDKSGSMLFDNKLSKMNSGLNKLIKYTLNKGTEIGLSEFFYSSHIVCNLTKITDDQSRNNFINTCLNSNTFSETCIGCGLLEGVKVLKDKSKGSRIILLTDGEQNHPPPPDDPRVIKALDNAEVFVDTIGFTSDADSNLGTIAKKYHGNFYFFSNNDDSNSLNEAFSKNPCDESEESDNIPLVSSAGTMNSNTLKAFVNIDVSVGNETKFIFDYSQSGSGKNGTGILVTVINPDSSKTYTVGSSEYHVDGRFKTIVVYIPGNADVGRWTYIIEKQTSQEQTYAVTILSKARDSGGNQNPSPLIVHATIKSTGVTYPSPMVIYSEITQGGNPVLAMKVVATIDRPDRLGDKNTIELDMKDNGQGADNRPNDGVYSRYFTAYTNTGRYAFTIRASNPNGTAHVRAFKTAASWGCAPAFDENNIRPYIKPTFKDKPVKGDISRTETTEASDLQADAEGDEKLTNGKDGIPPSIIIDLKVMETSLETGNVTLAWTAPGDNYDEGNVTSYQIVVETNQSIYVNRSIYEGLVPAGERQTVTLNVQPPNSTYATFAFTVVALDEEKNQGQVSNKVTAGLGYVSDITDGELPFTSSTLKIKGQHAESNAGSNAGSGSIIIVLNAVLLLLILILG